MKKFTAEEDQFILDNYLEIPLKRISKNLGRAESSARQRLHLLGFKVPPEIIEKFKKESYYQKGRVPENKGKKMSLEMYEKCKPTMFKKGFIPHNTKYDGAERISKDGYVEKRVSVGKYKLKHRIIWEEENGPIPKGFLIIFKDKDKLNFDIDNLEMISKGENAIRNRFSANYPREIQKAEYNRAKLKSKIKNHGKKQII